MSDAQGDKNDPATGEPIEERAGEPLVEAPAAEPAVDERPSALADAIGEDPDASAAGREPVVTEPAASVQDDAGPAPEATTPVGAPDPEPVPGAAAESEPATPEADAEPQSAEAESRPPAPDYAALAAELDELDARHSAAAGAAPAEPAAAEAAAGTSPWFERADETQTFKATDPVETPSVTASEPTSGETTVIAPQPQPVFVEAPEPPTKRGNRGAAGLIGLLAAIVFGLLYFGAVLGYAALTDGFASVDDLAAFALETVASVAFWIPVVAFFLAFWLLGAIVNRARWVAWVLLGFFVAVVTYAAQVFAPVLAAPFWMLTPREAADLLQASALTPLAIAAFVIAREVTIWFGAWVARRGAKMNRLNAEAQEEYERTLEAGPAA